MEEAKSKQSSKKPVHIFSVLAKEIGDLAAKEKNIYRPILKKWHPHAAGVSVATLHDCFGSELKKFIVCLRELTPDAVQVLKAADKLEKDLVHIAMEDSVDTDDGGTSLVREMTPYEAGTVLDKLVKAWIKERVDKLQEWADQNLELELSLTACQEGIQQLCETTAYKVIFNDLSHVLLDTLYIGSPSSNRILPLLKELGSILKFISAAVHDRLQNRLITALMKASFDGFLLVLLAGGPARAFSCEDCEIIEDDFRALRGLYLTYCDGMPEELVVKASSEVKNILPLLRTDTEALIRRFKQIMSQSYGSTDKSRFPMPPVPAQWSPDNPNTILRVLCYRNDEAASKFLKQTYDLPKTL
ncbi:hypothetical protein PR202_gb03380 [Eleusine coracana subsp. coracana]|uniref:MHD1 domain-containing protein n=1 Tax=Eleusine coracana subsp. coracana TaxID=191504 RepID=A0AAV5E1I4_ELECO|nr:hypothetical protein PR202_gb03380 [Eleusine coracana subsp. coracana]